MPTKTSPPTPKPMPPELATSTVPLFLVPALASVAGASGSTEDWHEIEKWAAVVGLQHAATAVHALAAQLDPTNRWSVGQWHLMISGASGQTGGVPAAIRGKAPRLLGP